MLVILNGKPIKVVARDLGQIPSKLTTAPQSHTKRRRI